MEKGIVTDILGSQSRDNMVDKEDIEIGNKAREKYGRIEKEIKAGKTLSTPSFLM